MSLLLFCLSVPHYAKAMPMLIPPMAISMQKSINMIRMIIFVDFFIFFTSFRYKYNTRNLSILSEHVLN